MKVSWDYYSIPKISCSISLADDWLMTQLVEQIMVQTTNQSPEIWSLIHRIPPWHDYVLACHGKFHGKRTDLRFGKCAIENRVIAQLTVITGIIMIYNLSCRSYNPIYNC